jgi:hypothetical protein
MTAGKTEAVSFARGRKLDFWADKNTRQKELAGCATISRVRDMAEGEAWRELVPPAYPEGDYVAVFCHKCGGKNRQDDGWRYRNDPVQRSKEAAALNRLGSSSAVLGLLMMRSARLTYQCDTCRDDRPHIDADALAADQTITAAADQTITAAADQTITAAADQTITAVADHTIAAVADHTIASRATRAAATKEKSRRRRAKRKRPTPNDPASDAAAQPDVANSGAAAETKSDSAGKLVGRTMVTRSVAAAAAAAAAKGSAGKPAKKKRRVKN